MPIRYVIDTDLRRIVATVSGQVTLAEITAALTTEQVEGMSGHLRSLADRIGGARWAIVTTSLASYGMMRMLSVHAETVPMDVRVFREAGEAEEWLASPKEDVPS